MKKDSSLSLATQLINLGRPEQDELTFVNPRVSRGSTVLAPTVEARNKAAARKYDQALVYGRYGTETHHALEDLINAVEGGNNTQIVSSGLAACTLALMSFVKPGDHYLVVDSCYTPVKAFCDNVLRNLNVDVEYFSPQADIGLVESLMRPNTRLIYLESPGSHTFEMQDVPALATLAKRHSVKVLMDNTWGFSHFKPFKHGVDLSIQSLTKYACGHSDVMLGSVTTASQEDWKAVRDTAIYFGQHASSDDCWLTIRGMRTLKLRTDRQAQTCLTIAEWLRERPEVSEVQYPPLSNDPGHMLWQRDYTGAASLFGVVLAPGVSLEQANKLVDTLELFGIGSSWGGFESLVIPLHKAFTRNTYDISKAPPALRFHVGLEEPADLIADLERAFRMVF